MKPEPGAPVPRFPGEVPLSELLDDWPDQEPSAAGNRPERPADTPHPARPDSARCGQCGTTLGAGEVEEGFRRCDACDPNGGHLTDPATGRCTVVGCTDDRTQLPTAQPPGWLGLGRTRPKLLDLFCGGGGCSAGYHAAGFDVTGVDLHPQPDYPYRFVLADALTVDLTGFDVVAASPPCQHYSRATPTARRGAHPDLVGPVRERLRQAVRDGLIRAYVIENVPGAPMAPEAVTICGDSLRLGVRRHRLFESNLPLVGTPCWHDRTAPPVPVYGSYGQRGRTDQPTATNTARQAMGIDWLPWPALAQAIPPAYTHWLGVQLLTHLNTTTGPAGAFRHCSAALPSPIGQGASVTSELGASVTPAGAVTSPTPSLVDAVPSPPPAGFVTRAPAFRHCLCGNPLPPRPDTGRWPRYCSHACRQAAYRARHTQTRASFAAHLP